jgi:hypothetical protein
MTPFIELASVWEDDSLFEVSVRASNGTFSAAARCYTTREEMEAFSSLISGFPKSADDSVAFTTYGNDNFSYFSTDFITTDKLGHAVVRVHIAQIESPSNARKLNNHAEFEFKVEPYAVSQFSASLRSLAKEPLGTTKAQLNGTT